MNDYVTDKKMTLYPQGTRQPESMTFRDMFRMAKNVNIANAFSVL